MTTRNSASAFDAMTRPERVRALWSAMSARQQQRAWSLLSNDQRVEAIRVLFDTEELESDDPQLVGHATAFDRWQREADR